MLQSVGSQRVGHDWMIEQQEVGTKEDNDYNSNAE